MILLETSRMRLRRFTLADADLLVAIDEALAGVVVADPALTTSPPTRI